MIEIMTFIRRAIVIIELLFAPTHIIMMGPRATFGKEFNIVKNGSNVSAKNLFKYMSIEIIKAIKIPNENDTNISVSVTPMWTANLPLCERSISVFKTLEGEEKRKVLMNPFLAPNSQSIKNIATTPIWAKRTFSLYLDI